VDLNRVVIVNGTIIRIAPKKNLSKSQIYTCTECQKEYRVYADIQEYHKHVLPEFCRNMRMKDKRTNPIGRIFKVLNQMQKNQKGQNIEVNDAMDKKEQKEDMCRNKKFDPLQGTENWIDYQEIKIQEPFKTSKPGFIPRTI